MVYIISQWVVDGGKQGMQDDQEWQTMAKFSANVRLCFVGRYSSVEVLYYGNKTRKPRNISLSSGKVMSGQRSYLILAG